jgi:multicomponent Na+:H+ antiporter subunit A
VLVLLALHLAMAIAAPALARRLGPRSFLIAGIAPLAMIIWAATQAGAVLDGTPVVEDWRWAPELGLELGFRLDAFALLMVTLVSGIGCLIFLYSRWYVGDGPGLGRLVANLVGFAGAMLGVVVTDNLLVLFVFWELTSITSYLLIGHNDEDDRARAGALQALLTTGVGGLAMLAGFVLLAQQAGTYSLVDILADPPSGTQVHVALALVLAGAFAKSAQVPFQSWLPGAMVAPTPVSAYLHSATMVTAGVYLIARLAPAFSDVAWWEPVVLGVGLTTMAVGAWSALRQDDLKLLLAYGTISQLGFMTVLVGAGFELATLAGVALLLAHGVFKAGLFMVTGIVEHETGTRDLRRLSGVGRAFPALFVVAAVCAASMAGIPPLVGFVTKELAFDAFLSAPGVGRVIVLAGLVGASALTVAYSGRYLWGAFATKEPLGLGPVAPLPKTSHLAAGFVAPAAALALTSVAFGVAPELVERLVVGAAGALDEDAAGEDLALWHGLNAALALSAVAVIAGIGLLTVRRSVARFQERLGTPPEPGTAYGRVVRVLVVGADRITGVVQSGSLPVYLGVILFTALAVPSVPLLVDAPLPRGLDLVDRPAQAVVAVVVVVAALAAVRSRHRLAAVLAVGATGYGIAVLFVLQGAPDLALTQVLIETLMLVLFVFVLRNLPKRFRPVPWRVAMLPRLVIAVAVGVFVAGFAMVAATSRVGDPVSGAFLEQAYPEGDGRNVVNVILVDFRALDTMGEIVVLTTATLGIVGLVRAGRRERGSSTTTRSERTGDSYRRSLVLDVVARLLVPTVAVFGLFLLVVGHNRPGGGFIAGLVVGAAFVLLHVTGYVLWPRGRAIWAPEMLLGIGVALAVSTGMAAWVVGGEFLQSGAATLTVPRLGDVKAVSTLAFDTGVFLVVLGLVLGILRSIAREPVRGR